MMEEILNIASGKEHSEITTEETIYENFMEDFFKEVRVNSKIHKSVNFKEKINIDIKLSREAKKLPIILTKNEILKLIENISNLKHKLILKLAYWSWLRVSEVIDLKVWDVNIDNLTIHIKNAKWQKVD